MKLTLRELLDLYFMMLDLFRHELKKKPNKSKFYLKYVEKFQKQIHVQYKHKIDYVKDRQDTIQF